MTTKTANAQAEWEFVSIRVPMSEIGRIEAAHLKLMGVLLSFADRSGRCWPALRTIAERAGETLSWVSRHLREMQSLGYFERKRRFASRRRGYFYQLAKRFLSGFVESHRRDSSETRTAARNNPHESQACPQVRVPPVTQKENPEKDSHESISMGGDRCGAMRRLGRPVLSPEQKTALKRKAWLKNIHDWCSVRLFGRMSEMWAAWAVLAEADKVERSAELPREIRTALNDLNEKMRRAPLLPGELQGLA